MNDNKYIGDNELAYFLSKLTKIFGLKTTLEASRNALDTYILNIKYSDPEDDTSSAVLGIGKLGMMMLGKS